MNNRNAIFQTVCMAMAVLVTAGCAGYYLGANLPPGINSVAIPTFINESTEPRLETACTSAAIQEFQKDGSLRVVNEENADTLLIVKIKNYTLIPLRYQKDSAKTAKEYRILLKVELKFTRKDTGEVIVEKLLRGESTFETAGDLSSAKRAALPIAAKDLAHDIVESVVENW